MTEHRIRFRGAWDWIVREGEAEVARRVTLPTGWPPGVASPFQLLRRFGRPPGDPAMHSARLELIDVPGLVVALLNGVEVARPPRGAWRCTVPLAGPLLARNALVLEVDLESAPGPTPSWGSIALVIGPKGSSSG